MTKSEIKDLLFLEALRAAGVDNWNGYDYAWEIYQEMVQDEPELRDDD